MEYHWVVRNRTHLTSSDSWLGRMERQLLSLFGPAEIGKLGKQPDRSTDHLAGVQGWELRRDSTGSSYIVPTPENERDQDEPPPPPRDD
jgi:hypothetical protein